MKYVLWIIALLLLTIPAFAQDETFACNAPYVTEADVANLIISVDDAQITDDIFANRIRFEHAYNAIKFEIRVAQITESAEANNVDSAQLMSIDEQIRQINIENDAPAQLANRVLGELANDAVIWQYAESNALSVSQDDFDATVDAFFDIEDATSEERDAVINDFTQRILIAGTNPSELSTFFCRQILYEAVQEQVITNTETTLYVNADHILVSTEEVAFDIIALIEAGDDFATLAGELSLDVGSGQNGGTLGWQPVVFYVAPFADALLAGEVGTILAPVETQFGWHVIRLTGREERPVEDNLRDLIIESQFTRWREDRLASASISVNPDWQSFIPDL